MKKWKLIPLVSLFALFGLVSCGTKSNDDNPDNPPVVVTKYKITYVSEHGTKPADKTDVTSITEADLPTLTDDEYTFGGWFADANYTITVIAGKMTSDMTLYAKWTKKSTPAATYSITYVSEHGTKPSNKTGVTAITEADLPTLTDDEYTFGGWYTNEALTTRAQAGTLSANVTLYAKWTAKPVATYSITYVSDHGTKPSNKTNVTSITEADLPTLTDDNYTFGGWYTNSLLTTPAQTGALSTNVTLYAKWIAKTVTNTYTITFKNDDGTTISSNVYQEGETVTVPSNPTKASNAQYTYTFAGWDNTVSTTAVANATYTATYNATIRSYTVTWKMDDNTVIDTTTVNYGTVPTHANPTKADNAEYTYTFTGWNNTPSAVTGNVTYKATFSSTVNSYTITWKMDDDSVIDTTTVNYGAVPTHANPSKAEDTDYTYTFAGWTPSLAAVTGAATYKAAFNAIEKASIDENTITANTSYSFTGASVQTGDVVITGSYQSTAAVTIDKLTIDASSGKLSVGSGSTQTNAGTKLSFKTSQAVKVTITLHSYNYNDGAYTISGNGLNNVGVSSITQSFTTTQGGTVEITVNQDNTYFMRIDIELADTSISLTNLDVSYMKVGAGSNTSYSNGTYVTTNAKTLYMVGESFNANGIYGVATYSNNTTDVLYGTSLTYSGFDSSTTGKKTVTVSYTYNGTTLSDTFNVYVTNVEPSVVNNVLQVRVSPDYSGAVGTVVSGYNVFKTIGQALDYLRTNSSAAVNKHMYINAGTYNEKLEIDIPNLTIEGEGASTTIIEYDSLYGIKEADGFSNVTDSTQTVAIREAANNCTIKNITISNKYNNIQAFSNTKAPSYTENNKTVTYAGNGERGLALLVQADQFIMEDSRLLGWQDTLELFTGRQYFRNTYISGCIDYIFGTNSTTLFDGCEIHTVKSKTSYTDDSRVTAYITATKGINQSGTAVNYGLIFNDCEFTSDSNFVGKYAVARPWTANSAVAVLNSTFDDNLVATESGTIATGLISDVNVSTVKFKFYNNVYENSSAITLTNDLTNVDTTLSSTQAANYIDTSVIFGTSNGGVTYTSAWNLTITERIIITLELNGGSGTPTSVTINKGSILAVVEPTKSGYEFEGWCYDQACTTPYNDELLNTATKLYAKWTESTQSDPVILLSSGYTEAIYATFDDSNPEYATVKYKATSSDNWLEVDEELIRPLTSTTARVDIVGLEEGKYDIQVITSQSKQEIKQNITVYPDDRSGYAHYDSSTTNKKVTSGVGAYNMDGTLKSDAEVIYVTDATKNTVTYGSYVGLVEIISHSKEINKPLDIRIIGTVGAATWATPTYATSSYSTATTSTIRGNNGLYLQLQNYDEADLLPTETDAVGYNVLDESVYSKLNGLSNMIKYDSSKKEFDSYYNMLDVKNAKNVTVEGIGTDAKIFQWGFTWKNCESIEVKNLTFDAYTEDACSFEGGDKDKDLTSLSSFNYTRYWIHNNTFNKGKNYWDVCSEHDKGDGDGATDFKRCAYVTVSYNEYYHNHKTGLVGGADNQITGAITFHHNYYNQNESRLPFARQANMHMYNNYYYRSSNNNMQIYAGAYAFIENCYFDGINKTFSVQNEYFKTNDETVQANKKYYYKASSTNYVEYELTVGDSISKITIGTDKYDVYEKRTPAIKSYNNTFNGCSNYSGATIVNTRDEAVTNENLFSSTFDTDSSMFYYENGQTNVDIMNDTADVPTVIPTYAGAGKCNAITSEFGASASTETYDVSYVSAHGTAPSTVTGVKKITAAMLPTLSATGYRFDGWYFDSSFSTPATPGTISSNKVLYAKWTEKSGTETHSFNFNDGNLVDEDGFFTITASGGDASTSTNTGSIVYDGVTYTKTLKIDSKPTVNFTTTAVGQLTIVAGNNVTINIDGTAYTPDSDNVITISNLSSGSHTINKGAGQNYIYLIIVEF